MTLPIIDFVFIILIVAISIFALVNGFINELMGKVVPVLSIWITFMCFGRFVPILEKNIKMHFLAVAVTFLVVFVIVFILLKIIQTILKSIFSVPMLKSLDRFLGLVLGLVEGLTLVSIILLVLYVQPWFNVDNVLNGSIFARYLAPVISVPAKSINESLHNISIVSAVGALNV